MMDYYETFKGGICLALRERKPPTLDDMMNAAIEVGDSVLATRRHKQEEGRVREENQPSTSASTNENFDLMMKTMNLMLERLSMDNRPPPKDHVEPHVKNPNFKRP